MRRRSKILTEAPMIAIFYCLKSLRLHRNRSVQRNSSAITSHFFSNGSSASIAAVSSCGRTEVSSREREIGHEYNTTFRSTYIELRVVILPLSVNRQSGAMEVRSRAVRRCGSRNESIKAVQSSTDTPAGSSVDSDPDYNEEITGVPRLSTPSAYRPTTPFSSSSLFSSPSLTFSQFSSSALPFRSTFPSLASSLFLSIRSSGAAKPDNVFIRNPRLLIRLTNHSGISSDRVAVVSSKTLATLDRTSTCRKPPSSNSSVSHDTLSTTPGLSSCFSDPRSVDAFSVEVAASPDNTSFSCPSPSHGMLVRPGVAHSGTKVPLKSAEEQIHRTYADSLTTLTVKRDHARNKAASWDALDSQLRRDHEIGIKRSN
ncbi:hypothetical protein AHF37_08314 [Paragonimus kellicotti]|nr:hypothetical protein AHF37_08314 [Paragonimus kellicotti]